MAGDVTAKWIEQNRVLIDELIPPLGKPEYISIGYYYYNEIYRGDLFGTDKDFRVTIECSCYDTLAQMKNDSTEIRKLVFHSNFNLTSGWKRDTDIVANARVWSKRRHRNATEKQLLPTAWTSGGCWAIFCQEHEEHVLSEKHSAMAAFDVVDFGWVGPVRWILRDLPVPGATVLDPFVGFGTTLVACQEKGINGIGFDIRENRVAVAKDRAPNAKAEVGSATKLPLPSNSVDDIVTKVPYLTDFAQYGKAAVKSTMTSIAPLLCVCGLI